jgi:branched-chain amino acid transport system substrate-binding protein
MAAMRALAGALMVALAMFVVACGGDSNSDSGSSGSGSSSSSSGGAKTGKTFHIGLTAPLTGPIAVQGQAAKKWAGVMEKWLVSDKGPLKGNTVKITVYDTKLDPATAASVARRLVTKDKVIAISCCASSTEALQVAAIAGRAKVPSLGGAILTDLTKEGGPTYGWYFRGTAGEEDTVKYNLQFAQKQGYKKAVLSHSALTFGLVAAKQFKQFAPDYGMELIGDAAIAADATEATGQASKLAKLNPDVVFMADYPQPTAVMVRDLRAAGYKGPIVSNWSAHNDLFWTIAGKTVENLWAHTNYDPTKPYSKDMIAFYKQQTGEDPAQGQQPLLEAHNMNILGIAIANALKKTDNVTGADVQKALLEIKDYPMDNLMLGAPGAKLTYGRPYVSGSGQNPYHGVDAASLLMEQPINGAWEPAK